MDGIIRVDREAKPHERWNRARAAVIAYDRETNGGLPTGGSMKMLGIPLLIDLQRAMIEETGSNARLRAKISDTKVGAIHTESPDIPVHGSYMASIGGYDIYEPGDASMFSFLMIRSNEPGDYVTTDHPIRLIPGFFQPDN